MCERQWNLIIVVPLTSSYHNDLEVWINIKSLFFIMVIDLKKNNNRFCSYLLQVPVKH